MTSDSRTKYWDERSISYGEKIEGVLFKSFPLVFNTYLHEWMVGFILDEIKNKKEKLSILDLGCGYGRVASEIIKKNKKNRIFGIDISKTYVSIFNKKLKPFGKAQVGDVKKLPFKKGQFDFTLSVTTLMYMLNKKEKNAAASEIVRVTKRHGKFILIEPNPFGKAFITVGGMLKSKGKSSTNLSINYTVGEMEKLMRSNKGIVEKKYGMPIFTLSLLPLLIVYKISPEIVDYILKIVKVIDRKLSWILVPSLYIVYVGYEKQ